MRSRAERIEWALRAAALAGVVWSIWWCVSTGAGSGAEVAEPGAVHAALARWSTTDPVSAVHARFESVPDGVERDWLRALRGAGVRVGWSTGATTLVATAVDAEPIADPRGVVRVAVAAPRGAAVVIGDRLGPIDSAPGSRGGIVAFRVPGPVSGVRAAVGTVQATAGAIDSLAMRRVLVLAHAGWEGKFVARALQDEGWPVDVRFGVSPKGDVESSRSFVIDTARYAAVVAVDSGASGHALALERYVASGGGLILGPRDVAAVPSLAPGASAPETRGLAELPDSAPSSGLVLAPVVKQLPGAVVLERRDSLVTVAARRVERGRVAQIGYEDTWRWRMQGGDSGVAGHRAWWARLVAAVANVPAIERDPIAAADPAPLATAIDRLGAPSVLAGGGRRGADEELPAWLFAGIVVALVAEWASRRVHGRR
jgi:hypothetical protein